jgi:hypothetical protein
MPKTARQEQVPWKTADLVQNAFTLPLTRLSFPRAPYLYSNREHVIMTTTPIGRADVMIILLALALYAVSRSRSHSLYSASHACSLRLCR